MSSLFGININILTNKISSFWQQNLIDNPDNLKNHNVYIFSGSRDTVVAQSIPFFNLKNVKILII